MLATSVRVSPCSARSSPRSVGRLTVITPSSCSIFIRCGTAVRSSPLGPDTVTRPGSTETSTPAGTWMGCLPMRDMSLPDKTNDFAADALRRGGAARDHAAGRGQDCSSEAAQHARQAVLARVDAPARLGHALEAGEHALAATAVLELDDERLVGQLAGLDDVEAADVALLLEDACDLFLQLRGRHLDAVLQRLVGVADAREHVGDWIRKHCFLLPRTLCHARDHALVGELAQADPAEPELLEHGARPAALVAAAVRARLELLRPCGLRDQRLLRHLASLLLGRERKAQAAQERLCLLVRLGGGRDRDVEAADAVDAVVVDLREDDLLAQAQRVVAAPVERGRV